MKYLLYYKLDNEFISDQIDAGGDGTKVVSVVDGVAWTGDREKVYYRYAKPNDTGSVTSYTVTVHYTDSIGNTLAQDDVYTVDTYIGKSTKFFITSKSIENYVPIRPSISMVVSSNTECNLVYRKDRKEMLNKPLTFNIISSGTIYWVTNNASFRKIIYYSKNGSSWNSIRSNTSSSAPAISVYAGESIQFKGDNPYYGAQGYNTYFSASTNTKFTIEGNIMSLINSSGFSTATTLQSAYALRNLFHAYNLIGALDLVLPATTLANYCYGGMFYGCTGLTTAPELPATTLAEQCYGNMFAECTSLTTAPELPATTLANSCYGGMFDGCTSLTTAPSILPATTLANSCYSSMFRDCRSLTTAPVLPATTLANSCYNQMFRNCTRLNYIKCLATNISASNCTASWVQAVQTTSGTFVKAPSMTGWTTGIEGIPTNWTVQDAS